MAWVRNFTNQWISSRQRQQARRTSERGSRRSSFTDPQRGDSGLCRSSDVAPHAVANDEARGGCGTERFHRRQKRARRRLHAAEVGRKDQRIEQIAPACSLQLFQPQRFRRPDVCHQRQLMRLRELVQCFGIGGG